MKTKLEKTIKEAYEAGECSHLSIEVDEHGYASVYRQGRFIQLYPSRLLAERAIAKAQEKCSRFIR